MLSLCSAYTQARVRVSPELARGLRVRVSPGGLGGGESPPQRDILKCKGPMG